MPTSNNFYKIISVVIAILLWSYVILAIEPVKSETIKDIPIQLLNEDSLTARGLALSGEVNYTVDVVVEGRRAELTKISEKDFVADADLLGFNIGKNYIPVMVTGPDSVTIMEKKPNKIAVIIEELVTATKPVRVNFTGQIAENREAGNVSTVPEAIEVTGARSEVDAVSFIQAEVNVSRLTAEETTIQTKAIAVNNSGDIVNNVRLGNAYIDVTARLFNVKEVPLQVEIVGEVDKIYEITNLKVPSSIKIKGTANALLGVSQITAKPVDISQVSSTSKLPVALQLPTGIEAAKGFERLVVDIAIKPVATKEFIYDASEIEIEGIEGASNVTITTPQISVIASGSEAVINELQRGDLRPYITLDTVSLLSNTAKIMIRYDKALGHISVNPEEVHLTLNQTETQ